MHRKKDLYCGLVLLVLGIWIAWQATGFPALAGMPYGAGLFPTIAAVGLSICGALILISSFISGRSPEKVEKEPAKEINRYHAALNTYSVIGAVILYALFLEKLGFHLVSFLALFFLFIILQVRLFVTLLLSFGVTFGVHYIFYSLLHVPLPWGILEPLAW